MKKYMIRCDIEGVSGVTTYQQAERGEFGRAMLANDLNAAIAGLLSVQQCEIVIYDEHTDGRNVTLEDLPDSVSVICGKPTYRPDWGGIDSSYDAMLMVGFHARTGVPGALLPHSYSLDNLSLRINGTEVGEIGMESAIAGDFGVPTLLVTGDSAGMQEAKEILPGVVTVTVKQAMGEFAARCYPPKLTARLIYEATRQIAASPPDVKPFKFDEPVELQVQIAQCKCLAALKSRCAKAFIDDNTLQLTGRTVTELWSQYLQMLQQA